MKAATAWWTLALLAVLGLGATVESFIFPANLPCGFNSITNGCSVPKLLSITGLVKCKPFFTPACHRHDICYRCGDSYNVTRSECDEAFYHDMLELCEKNPDGCKDQQPDGHRRDVTKRIPDPRKSSRRRDLLDVSRRNLKKSPLPLQRRDIQRKDIDCDNWAGLYYSGVRLFGGDSYNRPDADLSQCPMLEHCLP